MWFVFAAALILTVICSGVFVKYFQRGNMPAWLEKSSVGAAAVLLLAGVWDAAVGFGDFRGAFTLMGFAAAFETVLYLLLKKRKARTLAFMGKLLLAAVIAELTIFQFPSYRLLFDDHPYMQFSAADAELTDCVYDEELGGVLTEDLNEVSLTYRDIGCKIGTVYVNLHFRDEKSRSINFFCDMTDETGHYYRMKLIDSKIVYGSEESQYAMAQLSGKSDTIRFRFSGMLEDDAAVIESVELNKPIPFDVMPLRVILIVLIGSFVYGCFFSSELSREYENSRYICRVAATWLTIAVMCLAIMIVLQQIPKGGFGDRFRLTEGDQITEELVTAFENGRFDLDLEVSDELAAMENPYDNGTRFYNEIEYEWDHAYYNGKYYSYYGIAPLLIFVPYHLITGYFFPTDVAVMIFSSLGILFLSMLYSAIVRKWFGKISAAAYISGLAVLLVSCGIWFSLGRPMFYELAISAGFAACTAGAYFLVTSGIIDSRDKIKYPRVAASSLLLGLSVMCRPTLALYAVCGCVFWLFGTKKAKADKKLLKYLICAFLPIGLLGLFQMYYNYARFGSILEFGIKYSLTINDFTRTEFHWHFVFICLYNFLLAPPAFIPDYPFVSAPFSMLGVNGYIFKDEGTASGILFLALPVFAYFLSRRALKALPKKSRLKTAVLLGLPCLVMPVIIVASAWESGYSARYMADFSWQIVMGAMMILFFLGQRIKNSLGKKIFNGAMGVCMAYSLIVGAIEIHVFSFPQISYPRYADMLERLLEFWR
ncbi:MAG: hypothetical protein J6K77_01070 [Ruminococcus sp.]|nr:hypothetical protein [Ruminococcus sp.]